MFNDSFKLSLSIAELVALTEVIRPEVPDCLTLRLESVVRELRSIYDEMR